jgi:predicted DNA-binding antitoxin AbrB/MazE fold protein
LTQVLEAIYEDGVLKPLEDPGLAEHQRVFVEIREPRERAQAALAALQGVYEGLTDGEIAEVEAISLDRAHFRREED